MSHNSQIRMIQDKSNHQTHITHIVYQVSKPSIQTETLGTSATDQFTLLQHPLSPDILFFLSFLILGHNRYQSSQYMTAAEATRLSRQVYFSRTYKILLAWRSTCTAATKQERRIYRREHVLQHQQQCYHLLHDFIFT